MRIGHPSSPSQARRPLTGPVLLLTALTLYAVAALSQLQLPGLYYDEALDAVPAMQTLAGQPLDIEAGFTLLGRQWPLMVMSYVGSTTSYLVMPAFALFGVSVTVLRLVNIGLGLLTLGLTWGFLREFLDERVAGIATLLLAVNPTFVFWSRLGAFVSLPMLPLAIAALWSLFRWRQSGRGRYLAILAFCLGLGVTTKLLFVWLWLGLALVWLLLSPLIAPGSGRRAWLWPLRHLSWPAISLAALALLLGLAPLLAYNLQSLGTVSTVFRNAQQTELYGVSNLNWFSNLRTVLAQDLPVFLDGSWFGHAFGAAHRNVLAIPALVVVLLVIAYLLVSGQLRFSRNRILLLLILFVSIVLQSTITITSLGAPHLMILWPIPQALTAVALTAIPDLVPAGLTRGRHTAVSGLPILLALILLTGEATTTAKYHLLLAATGGVGSFSDSINAAAADLEREGVTRPIALDWGFRRSLQLLTRGRVNTEERFDYGPHPSEGFDLYINDAVARASRSASSAVYLLHSPRYTVFPGHWEVFEEAAYRYGMTPAPSHVYKQRNGETVSLAYRLVRAQPLAALPSTARRLNVELGEEIRLLGYEATQASVRPAEVLTMTLYWQAQKPLPASYKVFAHMIGPDGQLAGQHDSIPRLWGHPTTRWQAGEIIADRVQIQVSPDADPGQYGIFVGMYAEADGQRLPLSHDGTRLQGDTLRVVDVAVP